MTLGIVAKLAKGQYSLDISSGRYAVVEFIPPTAAEVQETAPGLSSNRYGGGALTNRRGINGGLVITVRVMGASQAEVERGVEDVIAFSRLSGDEAEPLYLEWLPNNYVPYKPLWGQSGWKRIDIKTARVERSGIFNAAQVRGVAQIVTLTAETGPYPLGLNQRLATAAGGIFEDYIGSVTGFSRGLRIPEATVNRISNPVFGNATFGTGWTAGANVTAAANYDKRFRLFDFPSARLVGTSASTGNSYAALTNVASTATHTTSAYLKKPDGSAVTSSDAVIYTTTDGEITSTYQGLGDGWYRVYASHAGVSSTTEYIGVALNSVGSGVYLAGLQTEAKAYPTLLHHGDMMGGAWSTSGAHAGTSTRTAGTLNLDSAIAFSPVAGTVRAVLEMDCDQTSADFTVFQTYSGAAKFDAYFKAADDKFYFTDATNTVSSAAQTWSIGDTITLHFVWKAGELSIYKNGASIATGSTYTPAAVGTMYIGCDQSGAEQARALWLDFTVYDVALTAAEVLADYGNITQVASDGQRVGTIPWLHNPAPAANYGEWTCAGGIPGDVDADTYLEVGTAVALYIEDTYINLNQAPRYSSMTAGGINAIYKANTTAVTVSTGGANMDSSYPNYTYSMRVRYDKENYYDKRAWIHFNYGDTTGNLLFAPLLTHTVSASSISAYNLSIGEYKAASRLVGPIKLYKIDPTADLLNRSIIKDAILSVQAVRTTGSGDVTPVYWQMFIGKLAYFVMVTTTATRLMIHGGVATAHDTSYQFELINPLGDILELAPGAINHMAIAQQSNLIQFHKVNVIPRYLIA